MDYKSIALLSLLSSVNLYGVEQRWTHFGLRPLAMGNAFVAVADDFNALFYNPAGLARLKTWDGELINPTLEAAKQTITFVNELTKLTGGTASGTQDVLSTLEEQSGKFHHLAFYLTPHFVTTGFGFGIGTEVSFTMVPHSNIDIELDAGPRIVAPIAFAKNFLEDRLSVGASVKFVARGGVNRSFNLDTISAFSKSDDSTNTESKKFQDLAEAGTGVGADVGMLFTPIETMEPTLGISVTDVGGTTYKQADIGGKSVGAPPPRLPAVNTGISVKPYKTEKTYLLLAVDSHIINQPVHYSHKLNFGSEWGFSDLLRVDAGLKEGYLTFGFQFDVGLLNLRFAYYSVDHGPYVGANDDLVEKRYAFQFKLLI